MWLELSTCSEACVWIYNLSTVFELYIFREHCLRTWYESKILYLSNGGWFSRWCSRPATRPCTIFINPSLFLTLKIFLLLKWPFSSFLGKTTRNLSSVQLSVYLSIYSSIHLSTYLSTHLSVCVDYGGLSLDPRDLYNTYSSSYIQWGIRGG